MAIGALRLIKVRKIRLFGGKTLAYITKIKSAVAKVPRLIKFVTKVESHAGVEDGSRRQSKESKKEPQYQIGACFRIFFSAIKMIMSEIINARSNFIG